MDPIYNNKKYFQSLNHGNDYYRPGTLRHLVSLVSCQCQLPFVRIFYLFFPFALIWLRWWSQNVKNWERNAYVFESKQIKNKFSVHCVQIAYFTYYEYKQRLWRWHIHHYYDYYYYYYYVFNCFKHFFYMIISVHFFLE